jgi:hypothetical protein
MGLFRRNSKFHKIVIISGDAIQAYLGNGIVAIKQEFVGTASLTKKINRKENIFKWF